MKHFEVWLDSGPSGYERMGYAKTKQSSISLCERIMEQSPARPDQLLILLLEPDFAATRLTVAQLRMLLF